jgi:hypothetical protein
LLSMVPFVSMDVCHITFSEVRLKRTHAKPSPCQATVCLEWRWKIILYHNFTFDIPHSSFGDVHKLKWDAYLFHGLYNLFFANYHTLL